jgi:hypothetical protein
MAISATGIQLASQSGWQQSRLAAAERGADRAEAQARSLRSQADAAQREAGRAQENARSLQVEADQAETTAGQARRGIASLQASTDMANRMSLAYDRYAQVQTVRADTSPAEVVVNALGEATGQVVSEAA